MVRTNQITVGRPVVNGHRVRYPFTCTTPLRRYFKAFALDVAYDVDVGAVPPSLLAVPAVANLISIAWVTGTDLHVETLDATFLRSLDAVRGVFRAWYPGLPFTTTLHVDAVVNNSSRQAHRGLLFSGGVDSYYSYLRNIAHKPTLIMMWGADPPWLVKQPWSIREHDFWQQIQARYRRFAAVEGVAIHFITTTMREFVDEDRMNRDFGYHLDFWWGGIQNAVALLGTCTPLAYVKGISPILIASDGNAIKVERWGNPPQISNNLKWADTLCLYDGHPFTRHEKIRYIADTIRKTNRYPLLRVCWSNFEDPNHPNCVECAKCLLTITSLVVENIDPNLCGFHIEDRTIAHIQEYLLRNVYTFNDTFLFFWRDIQTHMPQQYHTVNKYRTFCEWFRRFEIPEHERKKHPLIRATPIALRRRLPESLKRLVRRHVLNERADAQA